MKKTKKVLSLLMAAALTVSMSATSAFASTTFSFTYPDTAMDVNSTTGHEGTRYLRTLAQRASSEIPLVFGINVIAGNIFDGLRNMGGTSVNTNPDPYLWNFNYLYPNAPRMADPGEKREGAEDLPSNQYYNYLGNKLTNPNGLYWSGGANQVYANANDAYGGVGEAVGYRAEVMIGFNSALIDQIDKVRSWKSGDEFYQPGDENYSPVIVDVQTGSVTSRLYSWMDMAEGLDAYLGQHPEFALRYGNASRIAGNLEQFSAGIPYYIASLIADGKIEKKTMAYVYNIDGTTYNCINPRRADDVSSDVYGEVNNFVFLEGSFTLKQLMDEGVDIIVLGQSGYAYTGGSISGMASAASTSDKQTIFKELVDLGYKADQVPMVFDKTMRNVLFGNQGYNFAPTTPMYMTYIQAYAYMDELKAINDAVNPMALYRFMYEEFGHVNAASAEDVALYHLGSNWDSVDDEYDKVPDLANYKYDKDAIIQAIRDGVAYAQSARAEANDNTLVGAKREDDGAFLMLKDKATEVVPPENHEYITITANESVLKENGADEEKTLYLDLTELAKITGDDPSGGGDYTNTRTSYQAIIDYYNSSEYGYGSDLQTTLQDYATHMVPHVWDPDTTVAGTYAEGVGQANFTDVKAGKFYEKGVAWAVKKGVTTGTSPTTFSPDNTCNRAQMVTFLYRAAGSPANASANNPFEDVSEKDYYYQAVLWAVDKGITKGMDAKHFDPKGDVTRGQAVTFMNRLENQKAASAENPFTDVTAGTYFYDSVLWAVEKGITNGMTKNTFEPGTICTRGHIVTFLERYLG